MFDFCSPLSSILDMSFKRGPHENCNAKLNAKRGKAQINVENILG